MEFDPSRSDMDWGIRFNTFHVTFQVLQMSLKLYAQETTKLEFWMHIDAYNFAIESYHKRSIFDV